MLILIPSALQFRRDGIGCESLIRQDEQDPGLEDWNEPRSLLRFTRDFRLDGSGVTYLLICKDIT